MSESTDKARKRLRFRCHHTGMKENDLLFGAFADRQLATLSDADVAWFESLLVHNNDIDLYNWVTGKEPLPEALDHPVMRMLRSFKYAQ
jgi:antitoxin CptB